MKTIVAYDGNVHIKASQCDTCIFRPGNLMHLEPGRVDDMVAEAIAEDGQITCHSTLDQYKGAICRGFWVQHRDEVWTLRLAEELGYIKEV
jgi:hypothetical protein